MRILTPTWRAPLTGPAAEVETFAAEDEDVLEKSRVGPTTGSCACAEPELQVSRPSPAALPEASVARAAAGLVRWIQDEKMLPIVRERCWNTLIRLLDHHPNRVRERNILAALHGEREVLPGHLQQALAARIDKTAKTRPPYTAWFLNGKKEINIALQCQDEFYPAWVDLLEQRLGFELTDADGKTRYYTKVDNGVSFNITVRETEEDMFAPMGDPNTHVVVWCGHSDWWARVSRDLNTAPKQVGEKVLVNLMCFGRHFLDDLLQHYSNAHIITGKDPTEDSEDQATFKQLLAGLARGDDWKPIAEAVRHDPANPDDNVIFPHEEVAMGYVVDSDKDGKVDSLDAYYAPGPDEPGDRRVRSSDFVPRENRGKFNGRKVLEVGLLLNSLSYDNELLDGVNAEQDVRANGYYRGRDDRVMRWNGDAFQVNRRYAHSHPSALVGMGVFEGTLELLARVRCDLPPEDRALMALATAVHVGNDNTRYVHGRAVYNGLLAHYRLPAIKRGDIIDALEVNIDWESGSRATIAALKRELSVEQLEQLAECTRRLDALRLA